MNMEINKLKSDYLNTIGFIEISKFEGITTLIDLEYSKLAFRFLDVLKEMGFKEIEIGIDDNRRLLFFLSSHRKMAIAFAPKIEEDD